MLARLGARNKSRIDPNRTPGDVGRSSIAFALIFLAVVALCGGSSRGDSLAQIPARLAAIVSIAFSIWLGVDQEKRTLFKGPLRFLWVVVALFAVQLIPLPPTVWASINGRSIYDEAQQFSGHLLPWRPLNVTPDLGINAILSLLPLAAALLIVRGLSSTGHLWVLRALVVSGICGAILGFLQMAQGAGSPLRFFEITSLNSPVGFFANRNHQALWLVCTIILIWTWALAEIARLPRSRAPFLLALGMTIALVFAVIMTGSRAGVIILPLAGVGLYCMISGSSLKAMWLSGGVRTSFAVSIILVVVAMVIAVSLSPQTQALRRLYQEDFAADARNKTLPTVLKLIPEYAPFGSGFGSFERVYRHIETVSNLDFTYFNHAHNDLLELLIEGGAPALILLCLFVGWWARASWKIWAGGPSADIKILLGRTATIVTAAMMAASLPDYPMRTPFISVAFTICLGWMIIAQSAVGSNPRTVSSR